MGPEDEADFEEVVTALAPRLHRAAYGITRDHHRAEDAVQAALAKAWARWHRVRRTEHPEAYLRRMVVNEVLSWRRRAAAGEIVTDAVPDRGVRSDEAVYDTSDAVWHALGGLAPRQRAVVVLRYYEGLSEAEIADALGVRPGTVKSQASAALANLRAALADTVLEGELA